ncbi:MAG: ankyrin repeat protein [Mycoplasmataceae bacterium RV_VA103A]|nr:MAG: ankyrin repeat protein [Mycoplasmataceae bacterium RV_VA103A]
MLNFLTKFNKNKQKANESNTKPSKNEQVANKKEKYLKNYPLHHAASRGDLVKVKEILQSETVMIDAKDHNDFTPLHIAVGQDHYDIVIELLKHGADPNAQDDGDNTPLHFAAEGNNLKLLKCLVKNKYGSKKGDINKVNICDWSILHSVASGIVNEGEDWEIMEWMLKKVDPDSREASQGKIKNILREHGSSYVRHYEKLLERVQQEENFNQQLVLPK